MMRVHHVLTLTPEQWGKDRAAKHGFFEQLDPCRPRYRPNEAPTAAAATATLWGIPVGVIVYSSEESDQVAS